MKNLRFSYIKLIFSRCFSTTAYARRTNAEYALRSNENETQNTFCRFKIPNRSISFVHSSEAFYDLVLNLIRKAENRLVISTLYIGTGNEERKLVNALHDRIRKSYEADCKGGSSNYNKKPLQISLILDYLRGTRLDKNGFSSCTLLSPLLCWNVLKKTKKNQEKINLNVSDGNVMVLDSYISVSLFRNPLTCGCLSYFYPQRLPEILGVQHMKAIVCDDLTMITGANLSSEYFNKRTDRYILIRDREFSNTITAVLQGVAKCSYKLLPSDAALTKADEFLKNYFNLKFENTLINESEGNVHTNNGFKDLLNTAEDVNFKVSWPDGAEINDPMTNAVHLRKILSKHLLHAIGSLNTFAEVNGYTKEVYNSDECVDDIQAVKSSGLSILDLSIQAGFCTPVLNGQTSMLNSFFQKVNKLSHPDEFMCNYASVVLASPYMNLPTSLLKKISNFLRRKNTILTVVSASPRANSFYKSAGLSGYIPICYAALALETASVFRKINAVNSSSKNKFEDIVFLNDISNKNNETSDKIAADSEVGLKNPGHWCNVLWFNRPGWTFHTKGLWCLFHNLNGLNAYTHKEKEMEISYLNSNDSEYIKKEHWLNKNNGGKKRFNDEETYAATIFGSSNLSCRSEIRDLEMLFQLQTGDRYLIKELNREIGRFLNYCEPSDKKALVNDAQDAPWLAFIISKPKSFLGSMLRSFL